MKEQTPEEQYEQVVQTFVELFQKYGGVVMIGEALKEAEARLVAEAKQAKQDELEQIFDTQLQTLEQKGVSPSVIRSLRMQKDGVLNRANKLGLIQGKIPFLAVIPFDWCSLFTQMEMIGQEGKQGVTHLSPSSIRDIEEKPKEPYFIFYVEDGELTLGKSPKETKKSLSKSGRYRGLTVAEIIALAIHFPDILSKQGLYAVGSQLANSPNIIPTLFLNPEGEAVLGGRNISIKSKNEGTPSCLRFKKKKGGILSRLWRRFLP